MEFGINLIKDSVIPEKKRENILFAVIVYLFCCAMIFAFFSYISVKKILEISELRRQVMVMGDHMDEIKTKALSYSKALQSIEQALAQRIDLSRLFRRFYAHIPPGGYVDNIDIKRGTREESNDRILRFDIIVPDMGRNEGFNASDLIASWQRDGELMAGIKRIQSSTTYRHNSKESGSRFVASFSCVICEGGRQ